MPRQTQERRLQLAISSGCVLRPRMAKVLVEKQKIARQAPSFTLSTGFATIFRIRALANLAEVNHHIALVRAAVDFDATETKFAEVHGRVSGILLAIYQIGMANQVVRPQRHLKTEEIWQKLNP
jgi:hypothetical protein